MASSCIFFIISMPEENPKCGDVIGNPTKESHALGSKVENIDLNDKTTKRKIPRKVPRKVPRNSEKGSEHVAPSGRQLCVFFDWLAR